MIDHNNCSELAQLTSEYWQSLVAELKTALEAACGRPNVITIDVLDDWKKQIGSGTSDGLAITRQVAMQTVVTDYVINERINGTMTEQAFKEICADIRRPQGLDKLYAAILHLLAGSSVAINAFTITEEEGAH